DEFWEAYPPREGIDPKKPAQEQFLHAVRTGTDPQTIIDGAKKYAAVVKGINPKFVPMAHRWLRERRWEDRMEPRRSYRCACLWRSALQLPTRRPRPGAVPVRADPTQHSVREVRRPQIPGGSPHQRRAQYPAMVREPAGPGCRVSGGPVIA